MQKISRYFKQEFSWRFTGFSLYLLVCLTLFLGTLLVCPFFLEASAADNAGFSGNLHTTQDNKKTLRIGYQNERAFYGSPGTVGQEGYGYEYMNKILYYTKNDYTPVFVPVDWSEGLEMLQKGELDLLPFATYTPERAANFLYTKTPLTWEKPILLSLKEENPPISSDFSELQGRRICVYDHSIYYDQFLDFMNENEIYALFIKIPYKTIAELKKEGKYDYILSSSLLLGYDLANTISLKSSPCYIMANKENKRLVDEIDDAIHKLETENFLYSQKLDIKYFHYLDQKKENLSTEERWLLQDKVYTMGIMNMDAPISFKAEEGKMAGVIIDVVKKMSDLGNFKVDFIELPLDATDKMINACDFSILPYKRNSSEIYPISNTFGSTPLIFLKGAGYDVLDSHVVGTLEHFQLNFKFISTFLGGDDKKYIVYHSTKELVEAFNAGKIDCAILTRAIYNTIHDDLIYNVFSDLGINYSLPISFSQDFPLEKIKIMNKLITHFDQTTIDDFTTRNVAVMTRHNAIYYFLKYWHFALAGLLALFVIFIFIYRKAQKEKDIELQHANEMNPLTGLYTFKKFLLEARSFINSNPEAQLRIISLDIDHFSYINEIFGFDRGSKVLQQIAYHLKDVFKGASPICNYGGDDFIVITYKQSKTAKELLNNFHVDDFKKSLEAILPRYENFSFSVGVYDIVDRNLDVSFMVDCANIACHKSKVLFGTHVSFFTEEMKQESIQQDNMVSLVKTALAENEFELFYQPKFDIDKMHVVGAEALIRWFKDGKMIPPDKFIPILEKKGLISELDYHVIELACQFISTHRDRLLPQVSINISGLSIIKSELVEKIVEITNQYAVMPHELDFEITETALVNNFDMAINQVLELRELGFSISMDDFGTGVSSLNRLSQMPLDTIKLDRVFMMNALENLKSSIIVQTVIDLAKNIGAKTVAEGIETQEQLDFLRELSCESGQGYFYARPMSVKNFLEYLDENKTTN